MISLFQKKVYEVVIKIPRGEFLSYKQVAEKSGNPKAWRAVGNILNKNRNPEIPCHRVIRSDGKIGGYNKGSKCKEDLLLKEAVIIKGQRVSLPRLLRRRNNEGCRSELWWRSCMGKGKRT
ncbi:MAG: MGMT family protein [Candidatus Staskawiczbacteria bacterium]|jgi:O-6-methylguanine DNA methyltransferase